MSTFYAKRGPTMMPKLLRKSRIVFNDSRWVVFRKSLFYNCKAMFYGRFRALEIYANQGKRVRKQGPKKVCGIERKRSQNGIQFGPRNRQHFLNFWKNIPKTERTNMTNGTANKNVWVSISVRPGSNFGPAGALRGFQLFDSILVPSGLVLV